MQFNLKTCINVMKEKIARFGIILCSCYLGTLNAFCDDDIFVTAEKVIGRVQTKVVSIGKKLFPLALVIAVVSLFITHDERKLQIEIKILICLCVAYALLLLIDSGSFTTTINNLLN